MNYEQSEEWLKYCMLMDERPFAFINSGNINIITDINAVEDFVERTGKKIGVIYNSPYNILVVDLVKDTEGNIFTYERLLPAQMKGAVTLIPRFNDKYVLLKQYMHSMREYQYAFPRGFGEKNLESKENASKEIAEELGAEVLRMEFLGTVVPNSGICGTGVEVFVCDITEPKITVGYEGIQDICILDESEFKQWIRENKISDGFTLATWAMLNEQIHEH